MKFILPLFLSVNTLWAFTFQGHPQMRKFHTMTDYQASVYTCVMSRLISAQYAWVGVFVDEQVKVPKLNKGEIIRECMQMNADAKGEDDKNFSIESFSDIVQGPDLEKQITSMPAGSFKLVSEKNNPATLKVDKNAITCSSPGFNLIRRAVSTFVPPNSKTGKKDIVLDSMGNCGSRMAPPYDYLNENCAVGKNWMNIQCEEKFYGLTGRTCSLYVLNPKDEMNPAKIKKIRSWKVDSSNEGELAGLCLKISKAQDSLSMIAVLSAVEQGISSNAVQPPECNVTSQELSKNLTDIKRSYATLLEPYVVLEKDEDTRTIKKVGKMDMKQNPRGMRTILSTKSFSPDKYDLKNYTKKGEFLYPR